MTTTTRETPLDEYRLEEDYANAGYTRARRWLIETLDEKGNVIEARRQWRTVK